MPIGNSWWGWHTHSVLGAKTLVLSCHTTKTHLLVCHTINLYYYKDVFIVVPYYNIVIFVVYWMGSICLFFLYMWCYKHDSMWTRRSQCAVLVYGNTHSYAHIYVGIHNTTARGTFLRVHCLSTLLAVCN